LATKAAASLEELRDKLQLPFGDFNQVLAALGRPYAPIRHVDEHISAFADFLSSQRGSALDSLRAAAVADFDANRPVLTYAAAKDQLSRALGRRPERPDTPALTPDPRWLDAHAIPPTELMRERLSEWLGAVGADPGVTSGLPDLDLTSEANAVAAGRLALTAAPLVCAWTVL